MKTYAYLAIGLFCLMSSSPLSLLAQCPPLVTTNSTSMVFNYAPGFVPNDIPNSVTTEAGAVYILAFNTGPSTVQYNLSSGTAFSLPGSFLHDGNVCLFDADGKIDDFFLPVELSKFTAQLAGTDVQLSWETASEQNNAGFELERSFDGERFNVISALPGMGNSNTVHSYHFQDRNVKSIAVANTVYYRLKQIDWDGQFSYSEVVSVALQIEITQFGISRLVVDDPTEVQLFYQTADTKAAILSLSDLHGRLIFYQKLQPTPGFNYLSFSLPDNLRGLYVLHLTNGVERVNRKLYFGE